jgi:hypothetical protein
MFFDKKEKNEEVKQIGLKKGELFVYSGTIVSLGEIVKKRKTHPTIKMRVKTKIYTIVFDGKPAELIVGWKGTIVASEETSVISQMEKLNKQKGGSKLKGKLSIGLTMDAGSKIDYQQECALNDIWIRVSKKEKYKKFQFFM